VLTGRLLYPPPLATDLGTSWESYYTRWASMTEQTLGDVLIESRDRRWDRLGSTRRSAGEQYWAHHRGWGLHLGVELGPEPGEYPGRVLSETNWVSEPGFTTQESRQGGAKHTTGAGARKWRWACHSGRSSELR
jgi:hypothetical protein